MFSWSTGEVGAHSTTGKVWAEMERQGLCGFTDTALFSSRVSYKELIEYNIRMEKYPKMKVEVEHWYLVKEEYYNLFNNP